MGKKRLIDANKLKEKAEPEEVTGEGIVYVQDIDEAPTVDAVEVVHGRWIKVQEEVWHLCERRILTFYKCSRCKQKERRATNFCPNCGAKMDGDENG